MSLFRPGNCVARRAPALLAGLLIGMTAPAVAQHGTTGTITGRVTDRQNERPLGAVQVRISGTQRGAQTDEAGTYRITNVPGGSVSVVAQRIGYGPVSRTVVVPAGGAVTV